MRRTKISGIIILAAVLVLSFAPVVQRLVPFSGSVRTVDTSYARGSVRVDSVLRIVSLSQADTNWVLGVNDSGFLCWRYRTGSGLSFATGDLIFTGNRYHNVDRYNVDIDSANMFVIQDTSGNYALNINDTANYGNSLIYVSSRTDKVARISPSTSYLSRLFLQANASQNLCQLFAGNNKISFTETSSLCNISFLSGSANPAILVIDSVTRAVQINHLTGSGTISSVAGGTGAGTAPTITMGTNSTDLNGYINLTTGTGCATDATVATITFGLPYATAPKTIILSPANKATQNLAIGQQCFVNQAGITTTTFDITSNGTALADATAYKWYYFIVQ